MQLQLHYTTLQLQPQLQLQLQLRYTTLQPAVVVRWPLQPLKPFRKTQLQPPVGPAVDWLCHPWFTATNLSYRFPIFETSATALCGTTGLTIEYDMRHSEPCLSVILIVIDLTQFSYPPFSLFGSWLVQIDSNIMRSMPRQFPPLVGAPGWTPGVALGELTQWR